MTGQYLESLPSTTGPPPKSLSDERLQEYFRDGILFPVQVLSTQEVTAALVGFDELATAFGRAPDSAWLRHLHLFHRWAFDLATHPRVLDAVEQLIGPDILVHSTTMFCKYPRDGAYVSWHQDGYYLGLSALEYTSAWIALTDSSPDNGCMRVVRGSHRAGMHDHLETSVSPQNMLQSGMEVVGGIDEKGVVDVILRPGEMSLHDVATIHGSQPNLSSRRRVGFAVRYIPPRLRQKMNHIPVVLARGRDDYRHYRLLEVQSDEPGPNLQDAIRGQAELVKWVAASRSTSCRMSFPANLGLRWCEPAG